MPIYEEEGKLTTDDLLDLRKKNKCKQCGGMLNVFLDMDSHLAYLACNSDQTHEGIVREASRYEQQGIEALNIKTRREIVEENIGHEKTTALDKYIGVVSLTRPQAQEILVSVYPDAPEAEITRAVILCASYGLNPLMKHIFLIPFKRKDGGRDWVTVMGIKAKRLLSSRRGNYSYVDGTPRVMTEQEQRTTFGEIDAKKLWVMTKVKDPATRAEAVGYGWWPRDTQPHGTEKGNTQFNMAAIRSESQALDRLRPGEMPEGIEVIPEEAAGTFIEGEFKEVTEEPKEDSPEPTHWCSEHNCAFELKTSRFGKFYSHKLPDGTYCKEDKGKKKAPASKAAASKVLGLESEGKCPACGVDVKTTNEEDITCPNCGVTIHWQGSTPWIEKPEPEPVEETMGFINLEWLKESLETLQGKGIKAYSDKTILSYLNAITRGKYENIAEAAAHLDKGQAGEFVKRVQEAFEMA